MMKKPLFALIVAISAQAASASGFVSGNKFMELSKQEKTGYVIGISDALDFLGTTTYCPPKDITIGQTMGIAEKYLSNTPEERHLSASSLIIFSLQKAFPCK